MTTGQFLAADVAILVGVEAFERRRSISLRCLCSRLGRRCVMLVASMLGLRDGNGGKGDRADQCGLDSELHR